MTVFRHLLLSVLILCAAPLMAQSLTESAQISLLTCAPGSDLYSAFGHSAIRVYDPELGIDNVYNYGTFDFDPPGFYVEFVRGKLNYRLNTESYRLFDRVYRYLERSYQAQELDLTLAQKRGVYEFLETNALPENAYYLYDFFFDNCATRIRDVFVSVLGDSLRYANPQRVSDSTFRDLLDQYVEERAWSDFGIDLALGALIDRKASPWDQMFHPDYLAIEIGKAEILRNGQWQPLVRETIPVFTTPPTYGPTPLYAQPRFLFGLILLVFAFFTWRNWEKRPSRFVADGVLFLLAGIGGIILFLLWFATDHTMTVQNWNLLWLVPVHVIPAILLFRKQRPSWVRWYFGGSAAMIALLLLGWWVLPQALSFHAVPLMILLLLRSGVIWWKS